MTAEASPRHPVGPVIVFLTQSSFRPVSLPQCVVTVLPPWGFSSLLNWHREVVLCSVFSPIMSLGRFQSFPWNLSESYWTLLCWFGNPTTIWNTPVMMKCILSFKQSVINELSEGGLLVFFKSPLHQPFCFLEGPALFSWVLSLFLSTRGNDTDGVKKRLTVKWHFLCAGHSSQRFTCVNPYDSCSICVRMVLLTPW